MGFFEKLKNGLKKTKDSMMGRIESLLHSFSKIDEDLFEELEETLILCDIGVTTSEKICDKLRQKVKQEGVKEPEKIKDYLKKITTSCKYLLSLINDVLDMSRIESGRVKIDEKEVHLPDVFHDLRAI